ncbi:MAG: hypothetical protein K8S99_01850 [Planctomycetes bacterium]|nr:hypothetical protein [Planctomycetota bacterium]
MSYDLTIRPDEKFSRSVPREPLEAFIALLPFIAAVDRSLFVLEEKPNRRMEISLEVVDADGNWIEEVSETSDTINCIRLHVPYAFLGKRPERDYFPTAFLIADHLGWSLYDEQSGEDIPRDAVASDMTQTRTQTRTPKPWWRFW